MAVGAEVRQVEREIDAYFEGLPCWRAPRDALLRTFLDHYRDHIEVLYGYAAWGMETDQPDKVQGTVALEAHLHLGILQAIKWAGTLSHTANGDLAALPGPDTRIALVRDAHFYSNFVDSLKMANHGLHELRLLTSDRVLEVYEGGNRTGHDAAVTEHQHATNPFHLHSVFTHDDDQLTRAWSAGTFRRVAATIVAAAEAAETETVVSTLHGLRDMFKRPVVFEVPGFTPENDQLLDDLSFPSGSLSGPAIWRWSSWMDSPLVVVGGKRMAVSNHVKTALGMAGEMHMLRLAARVDSGQYSKVSQLREARMIEYCKTVLESAGWSVTPNVVFKEPDAELDLLAEKGGVKLLVELKSTLRPESPWETYNRNLDLMKGIDQVQALVRRVGAGAFGVVLTDGYRGDHDTWEKALAARVPTGTMDDLALVAKSPQAALESLAERAGITIGASAGGPVETREFELAGWTIRLIDAEAPPASTGGGA